MNFLIDYDTRSVQCVSDNINELEQYVTDNSLGLAVAIISEEDDLLMEMSVKEITELYHNNSEQARKFTNEEEAAKFCWSCLQSNLDGFTKYTKALGKRLLKEADKRSKDKGDTTVAPAKKAPAKKAPAKKAPAKSKQPGETGAKRKASYAGKTFAVGETSPMKGRHTRLVAFVEDNLGEATAEELEEFLVNDGTAPSAHINYAIKNDFIREV
jgi:hypothetical protein